MLSENFTKFDEERIQRFEDDWLKNQPDSIADYLPAPDHSRYRGTLEELVHIDLEFRWKAYSADSDPNKEPPRIESYLKSFPELNQVKLGLIQGEFDLAYRYGHSASVDDYVDRFGDTIGNRELKPILLSQLSEIRKFEKTGPGSTLDHYQILTEQGRGGFGAVWRAMDSKLGRRIAVKQLGQRLAADAESRRRFISEARVTAKLEHPGIVPVYDIGSHDDDQAYYTMRLIEGRTMAEAIEELHRLPADSNEFQLLKKRLLDSFVAVCQTMQYAHSRGVIHRDLKPQNIILGNYGETILLDWGLASVVDEPESNRSSSADSSSLSHDPEVLSREESIHTLQGKILGTPAYMPPEQARGDLDQISATSDVYSLGATLHHLLTGQIPFTDPSPRPLLDRVRDSDVQTPAAMNPNCEKPLSAIAMHAMSNRPLDRYPNVAQLLDDVDRFLADQPITVYRDPLAARIARWVRKNPTTAAATGLTLIFAFVASVAAILIINAWQAREEKRIANIQIAAERAEAEAISQIKNGEFDAAAKILSQTMVLVEHEPRLREYAQRVASRRDRTQRIVEFYRYGAQAQEETFNDKVSRAAIYSQAALNEFGVLKHVDWWNHLPDQDLTPLQQDQLRTEVYRVTTLLASTRLAETAKSNASLEVLFNQDAIPGEDTAAGTFKAARFAAQAANRFKPSRAMQLIQDVGQSVEDKKLQVDLTDLNPANSVDSGVMGSILDNNIPRQGPIRDRVQTILAGRDPNQLAKQWLDDAIKYNPDWYWLPVFMGHSQIRLSRENPELAEEAIRTFSHAVGIRPDYWVGYQFRAGASVMAAMNQTQVKRKKELLNAAGRDIQRAFDLAPHEPENYWTDALIKMARGSDTQQIANTFLKGYELYPTKSEIAGHFAAVARRQQEETNIFITAAKDKEDLSARLALLELVVQVWQGNLADADRLSNEYRERFPEHAQLQAFGQYITNLLNPSDSSEIRFQPGDLFAWQYSISNAEHLVKTNNRKKVLATLLQAYDQAKTNRQKSVTKIRLAIQQLKSLEFDKAREAIIDALTIDRAVNLSSVLRQAQSSGANEIRDFLEETISNGQPFSSGINDEIIHQPALLNASFELGLTYHWTPFARRNTSLTWNNHGGSNSAVEATDNESKDGDRSLKIIIDSPDDERSYGQMTQKIAVTPNATYEFSFWVKGRDLSDEGVIVGTVDKRLKNLGAAVKADNGTFDWTQFRGTFTTDKQFVNFAIRTSGSGTAFIDDIQIQSVQ